MILIMVLILAMIPIPNLITSTSFFLGLPFSYLQFELLHLPKCYLPINKIITLGQLDFCRVLEYCLINVLQNNIAKSCRMLLGGVQETGGGEVRILYCP